MTDSTSSSIQAQEGDQEDVAMSRASKHPPLLKLPAELRIRIYEDVLLEYNGIDIGGSYSREYGRYWCPPGLLQTCQQIRVEASPTYYSGNTFKIRTHEREWLRILSRDQQQMLRKVYDPYHGPNERARDRLRSQHQWLTSKGILLREDALHVCILHDDTVRWVNICDLQVLQSQNTSQ